VSQKTVLTTAAGVPIDCTGRFTGLERMPAALRAAGLVERLKVTDASDLPVAIDSPERDPKTGIIGFQSVCRSSETIRQEIGRLLRQGERPLVVGGCCTLLIGVFAALRDGYGDVGLAFVDGHLDFYDGASSTTGEAADMELAILTGLGPTGLIDLAGPPPLAQPQDIVVLGYRDAEQARLEGSPDPKIVAPEMKLFDVKRVRQLGPAVLGRQTVEQFEKTSRRFWLHLDLDVLDQAELPAVDYPMPDGLSWEALAELARPLAHSPALIGVDVTIYNPALDADGRYARRIVALLAEVFL
jgi:arginase